jgi:hypothetical protein
VVVPRRSADLGWAENGEERWRVGTPAPPWNDPYCPHCGHCLAAVDKGGSQDRFLCGIAERRSAEEETLSAYHEIDRTSVEAFGDKIWLSQGDASITMGFKDITDAWLSLKQSNADFTISIGIRLIR